MKKIYVLDTNALLYNPQLVYEFPDSLVIIPQAVLIELDKLKLSSMDPEVKFRGREVSRVLFELSEKGKLMEGIDLDNKSRIKVVAVDPKQETPPLVSLKTTDDQILAVAYQVSRNHPRDEVAMISNDLNMLLKAQTLDLQIERYEEKVRWSLEGLTRTVKIRQPAYFWLAIILIGVIVAICLTIARPIRQTTSQLDIPPELKAELEAYENQKAEYERIIEENPDDLEALVGLGNLYFDTKKYQPAVDLYQKALRLDPKNANVRTDMAIAYFNLRLTDIAIREVRQAIKDNPEHAYAYFNLGVFLWRGKGDYQGSLEAFQKYLKLEPQGVLAQEANSNIQELQKLIKKEQ